MTKSKIAIVGCGNIARIHGRLLVRHVNRAQIAVCDRDPLRLKYFAEEFGLPNTYLDLALMLSGFKPDVVVIATPPKVHKEVAIQCFGAGAHAFIEKPMCLSSAEADEIISAAAKYQRLVCVNHMRSYDPLVLRGKAMIDSGQFGRIVNVFVGYGYDYLERIHYDPAASWIGRLPGGSFFDLMPHLLCLLDDFLTGVELKSTICLRNDDDVLTDLHCLFKSGQRTANLHMSLNIRPLKNYIELECTKGLIRVDLRNFLVTVRKKYGLPNAVERIVQNLSLGFQYTLGTLASVIKFMGGKLDSYDGTEKILVGFLKAIEQNVPSPVSAQTARRLLKLAEEIFADDMAQRTRSVKPVNKMRPADILVTGGTGFIGRRLVNRLLAQGKKVRVFTHRSLSSNELRSIFSGDVDCFSGNIYRYADVEKACSGVGQIFHLAAAMGGDWNYHLDTTITGTQNILSAAFKQGIKKIIYVSTLNVYDAKNYPQNKVIDEGFDYEPNPHLRGAYSHAKLKAELYVQEFAEAHKSIQFSIFRPGLVYGPGHNAINNDVGIRLGKALLIVFGWGGRKLPLVYIDNLIDALVASPKTPGDDSYSYNVLDHEYPTQREFVRTYKKLTQEKFLVLYVPMTIVRFGFWTIDKMVGLLMKKESALSYKLACIRRSPRHSTDRLKKMFGWQQKVLFNEGLQKTIEAINSSPQ